MNKINLDLYKEQGKIYKDILIKKLKLLKINKKKYKTKKKRKAEHLLRNIKSLFDILKNIIEYLLNKSDNKTLKENQILKNINIDTIKLPSNIDELIILISIYKDSFNDYSTKKLYDIISLDFYTDLYKIYKINDLMFPFVASEKIELKELNNDFIELYNIITDFSCNILDLNTNYENISYLEESKKDQ